MNDMEFHPPVGIITGLGFATTIANVMEAYAFLNEQPNARRTAAHALALKACRAGLKGEIDADTVRAAFAAYARRTHILLPEAVAIARLPAGRGASA